MFCFGYIQWKQWKWRRRSVVFWHRTSNLPGDINYVCPLGQRDSVVQNNLRALLLISCLYCVNRFWLKDAVVAPMISYFLRCYFNDCLAGIAVIAYTNLIFGLSRMGKAIVKTYSAAALVCIACGILWEYLLPAFIQHGTSDVWDIAAYVLGGCTYIILARRLGNENAT